VFQGVTGNRGRYSFPRANNTLTFYIKKDRTDIRAVIVDEVSIPNREAFPSPRPYARSPSANKSWLSLSGRARADSAE